MEMLSSNETGIGGFKEVIFLIQGRDAFGTLKFESGVHRVQRVPVTESSGRIHTSAVSVAVLPEAEEVDATVAAVRAVPEEAEPDVGADEFPAGLNVIKQADPVVVQPGAPQTPPCREGASAAATAAPAPGMGRHDWPSRKTCLCDGW